MRKIIRWIKRWLDISDPAPWKKPEEKQMLRTLKNPRTKEYKELKKFILSNEFAWYWQSTATD